MMPRRLLPLALLLLVLLRGARADGPADNLPDKVRPIPPAGIKLSDSQRAELQAGIADLTKQIDELTSVLKSQPGSLTALLPDVQVYRNAVHYALQYNEFFNDNEVVVAQNLLKQGLERAAQLRAGKAPWCTATGLVVRGYRSKIDGSVQPYGLVVPASFQPQTPNQFRLDVWCHGRGETLSELNFIQARQSSPGEFTPSNTFVLHPYGRYCNANKFAGEIDLFEALEHVKKNHPIDENRLVMRGFSMGGAACWQFAVHYPSSWVAAAPGAGFAETSDFLKVFQNEIVQPTWYEKKLFHWYDATDYAANLFNCPTVAYSGETDKQKQAADIMEKALEAEHIELVHIVGAKADHQYTPAAKDEINRRIDSLAAAGRPRVPDKIDFTTWTLRYNRSFWIELEGLEQHWERARVKAQLSGGAKRGPKVETHNVSALTLRLAAGDCPFDMREHPTVELDGAALSSPQPRSDRSWTAHFQKVDGKWQGVETVDDPELRKRPGLQGPIDDAFMDSFLMVTPSGKALHEQVGKWTAAEMQHALVHWRLQFRGEARVKRDHDVTEADIAAHNLILWGDPASNAYLAKIADKLPIGWTSESIKVGEQKFPAAQHAVVLIFPNPLNPRRYVVLNSGFTYREYDYLNNARQVPKLPDFAVIDVEVPVSSQAPGGIAMAGFFTERWKCPREADKPTTD